MAARTIEAMTLNRKPLNVRGKVTFGTHKPLSGCKGWCCLAYRFVHATPYELHAIADYTHTPYATLIAEHNIIEDPAAPGFFIIWTRPCPWWQKNRCTVYAVRPQKCKDFVVFGDECNMRCHDHHLAICEKIMTTDIIQKAHIKWRDP